MTEIDLIIKNAEELLTLSSRRIGDYRINPLRCFRRDHQKWFAIPTVSGSPGHWTTNFRIWI